MKQFTEIASVYLKDVELINEAKKEYEDILADWWHEIIEESLLPQLKNYAGQDLTVWVNKSSPGMIEIKVQHNQGMYLHILDPRTSGRPYYTIMLMVATQPALRALERNAELRERLSGLAVSNKLGKAGQLDWKNTILASEDIELDLEDPEKTKSYLCDYAKRAFQLVDAHSKHVKSVE